MSLGSYLLGHTRRMLHITLWGKHLVTQLSQLQSLASGKASVCAHTRVVKIHLCQVHVRMYVSSEDTFVPCRRATWNQKV